MEVCVCRMGGGVDVATLDSHESLILTLMLTSNKGLFQIADDNPRVPCANITLPVTSDQEILSVIMCCYSSLTERSSLAARPGQQR